MRAIRDDQILFSESCGRFLVTVPKKDRKEFESIFDGLPYGLVGEVTDNPELVITGKVRKRDAERKYFLAAQVMDGLKPMHKLEGTTC